jgi:hypothetical protein
MAKTSESPLRRLNFAVFIFLIFLAVSCSSPKVSSSELDPGLARRLALKGVLGTYSAPPRLRSGRVDIPLLVHQLVEIHANTYSFCIWRGTNDWDDLRLFLPEARKHGIRVWASIVPPTESPPRSKDYSEPFRLDYGRWAVELARLSLREPNLVAWSIDDFSWNLRKTFRPDQLKAILDAARAINPRLAFVPCCYFREITPVFMRAYEPLLDGILFPYRHESAGANLTNSDATATEVGSVKEMAGPGFPVLIDVYASAHSSLGKTTPDYVRRVMSAGRVTADGVMVYCHQDPRRSPEKYQTIKELFTVWSEKGPFAFVRE